MVILSRQNCRVPSSAVYTIQYVQKDFKKDVQQIVILTLEGHRSINSFEVSIFQKWRGFLLKANNETE